MTIDKRHRGWLNELMHARLREALLHTCQRYHLLCPVYCLMPDHGHFLWCGIAKDADQLKAVAFFRRQWNQLLRPMGVILQKQAYDHVLNATERNQEVFEDTCLYVMKNAQRAELVDDWKTWPHLGAVIPGYPRFEVADDDFWKRYWSVHNTLSEHPGV